MQRVKIKVVICYGKKGRKNEYGEKIRAAIWHEETGHKKKKDKEQEEDWNSKYQKTREKTDNTVMEEKDEEELVGLR